MFRLAGLIFVAAGMVITGALTMSNRTNVNIEKFDDQQRKELWQQVQQAQQQGLPKTAIEKLDQIYKSALSDEDIPEAIKAFSTKLFWEANINPPMVPHFVRQMQSAIPEMPPQAQPILKTILADWFFSYYTQNRWRFAQRSQTTAPPSDDFETWDLPRLLNETGQLFEDVLSDSQQLKSIPIEDYGELLVKGNMPDEFRPTLYDFVAFQAIQFYALDEQIVRAQDAFDLISDGPIFGPVDSFIQWSPETDDEDSFTVRAIKLLQDLLKFHQDDDDQSAFMDADLARLEFGYRVAVGNEKTARYKAALQRFADTHRDHELSSLALGRLAQVVRGEEELVAARDVARQGLARFPDSAGGRLCHNIILEIESPGASVTTERVWNSAGADIDVQYKNVDKIYFRLIKFDYTNWQWGNFNRPEESYYNQRQELAELVFLTQWSVDLPETADFKSRLHEVPVDLDVASGAYLLLASHNADFSGDNNQISVAEVWVSELAVVMRDQNQSADIEGQVVNAIDGQPIAGATVSVKAWLHDGRNSRQTDLKQVKTNENGIFRVKGRERSSHLVYVQHRDQKFGVMLRGIRSVSRGRPRPIQRTVFFTDRSIYRPGQQINFKAVCVYSDQEKNEYKTLSNKKLTVTLYDVNNQQVEQRTLTTNQFGSASGSFTAPRDRATGRMRMAIDSGPGGNTFVQVEEYKRPKFLVELQPPEKAFQLDEQVTVSGSATAYTGAPIDGAKVVWRVVRDVRYPDWWMWRHWYWPTATESQEIANGISTTAVDGSFAVKFLARPDLAVDRKSEPVFTYTVYADVTDTAGETRSNRQSVRIGYTSLMASLNCQTWQTQQEPVELTIATTTLDGEGQSATGQLKIYKLTPPDNVQRAGLAGRDYRYRQIQSKDAPPDLSKINSWPRGEVVSQSEIATSAVGAATNQIELAAGAYQAVFETTDPGGQSVKAELSFLVHDLNRERFAVKIPHHVDSENWTVEPGEQFVALWGTGYETGRAFVELEHRGKVFKSYWTEPTQTQVVIREDIQEKHRGGLNLRITFVRENRAYIEQRRVNVPWTNKKLSIKWEHFVSKLQPGAKETWTAVIKGPDAQRAAAEMVAALYDASLDAFASHSWTSSLGTFYYDRPTRNLQFQNEMKSFQVLVDQWRMSFKDASISYRHFPPQIAPSNLRYTRERFRSRGGGGFGRGGEGAVSDFAVAEDSFELQAEAAMPAAKSGYVGGAPAEPSFEPPVDLSQVTARKNLQETAFFFPHLTVDSDGIVRIEFEIPEALTKWKFLGFAHDANLRTALLTDEVVTSKDLMVQPNPPRFMREGDVLEFSVKVSNQSATRQTGTVRLSFADARTEENMDAALSNIQLDQPFDIPAGQSESLFWKLNVPDFVGALTYKVVGATQRLSDGEEGMLPVLSKRILVIESMPLPIRGKQTKTFDFDRLNKIKESDTLQSQSLTVQMTSNPAWYAVMALPYLMEYPHQCSEQVFNRLYANAIARHIVTSDPKIRRVFDQWRATDALDSPLEKNEDIRNVLIAESPWLRAAKSESQSRRDVAILFDNNRLNNELRRALEKLNQMQYSDGSWPWFPGGRANDYITLYLTSGFGRLRHLGVDIDVTAAIKSLSRLDGWIAERHRKIVADGDQDKNNLSSTICLYLYARSFFLNDRPIAEAHKTAVDYFLQQAKQHWLSLGQRQSQGHLAISLKRFGDLKTPQAIMKSLTERSLTDEEMGMFWREGEASWWWYHAPIETQALMIEAYDEVLGDKNKVEDCKVWLLKQKQTQNWKTTKATADAVYALLLRGTDMLASDRLVEVSLGPVQIKPQDVEAGTGFYEHRFVGSEIKPELREIKVKKLDEGVAWGSVHWQYLEDVGKIDPYEGTPLTLKKSLFIKKNTEKGPVIEPVQGPVHVGDELVVRVELRVDRAMEYVHLKDHRGSGTEPVSVLSRYKFQDGLAYYESTKDTASHFFIDYLPRGTYVFEYSVRVQHRGQYQTGIAALQCMYAPEFNSHSGSVEIQVQ